MTLGSHSLGNGLRNGQSSALLRVLCVGEQSRPLAAEAAQLPRVEPVHVAANAVEAILLADETRPWDLIIAAISQEGAQLDKAIQALRGVNPGVKIVLLGEPTEEPACRRAVASGADDYFVLPTPLTLILQLSGVGNTGEFNGHNGNGHSSVHAIDPPAVERGSLIGSHKDDWAVPPPSPAKPAARPAPGPSPSLPGVLHAVGLASPASVQKAPARAPAQQRPRDESPQRSSITLAGLPLVVQSSLVSDILQAKSDVAGRLVATLQTYLQWPGILTFVPESRANDQEAMPHGITITAPVTHEAVRFGTLHLESDDSRMASMLDQAATWLASWMAMARRQEQLRALAITDELSGAYNRRYFTRFVEGLIDRARTQRFRVSLLLFDIDDFKHYNDKFGHAAGDAIIRALIRLLRRCTRPSDIVARIGGDEFAVVFWDSEAPRQPNSQHPKDAVPATERFRKAIEAHDWVEDCKIQGQVSISGGIATFPWDADTLEALLIRADEAMLQAKRAGKNVIHIHGTDLPCPDPGD